MFGFNGRLNTCAVKVPPTDNRRTDGEAGTHCKSLGAQNCVTWPTHSRQGNFKFNMSCPTQDTFPRGELWLKLPLNGRPGASAAPAGHAVFPGQATLPQGVRGNVPLSPPKPGSHPTQHPLWQSHCFGQSSSGISSAIGQASSGSSGDKVACFCQLC